MSDGLFDMTATTFSGLEEVLAKELETLGAENIEVLRRAVSFKGNLKTLYLANYKLRTAIRILKPVHEFKARSPEDLYDRISEIDWTRIMDVGNSFFIDAVVAGEVFWHSRFVSQKAKDAIVDQFMKKFGQRPNVEMENPQIRIHLLIRNEVCLISLDSSGESLHKRGYRKFGGKAPLSEVLAAGMLDIAGWDAGIPLIDPMCGSGTLLAEALMKARNIPAGHFREEWCFMHWPDFQRMLWKRLKEEEDKKISETMPDIRGSDTDERSVFQATSNLAQLIPEEEINIRLADFREVSAHTESGMIITNPPYDKRVQEDNLRELYRDLGSNLKQSYPGWDAWLISARRDALRNTGIKPTQNIILFNGPLECRYVQYKIFKERPRDPS